MQHWVVFNGTLNGEGSERQNGCDGRNLTTHWIGRADRMAFMIDPRGGG
jgi:hypothetical protein